MKKSIGFLGLLILTFCCSVKSEKTEYESIIDEWIGKKIILPRLSDSFKYNEKAKMVTKINGNCFQCVYRLKFWSSFISKVEETCENCNIQYYFYISGTDTSAFKTINDSLIQFSYPVIFDQNNSFYKLNKLLENSLYHTMLLDSLDKVLLIGTPIMNKKLQALYIDEIARINSN